MVEKCGQRNLGSGSHLVQVSGFQGGGGVGQQVRYAGPDTGGVKRWLRSAAAKYHNQGEPTKFSMCIFQAGYGLSSVPWLGSIGYVGVGQMPVINFNSADDFRQVLSWSIVICRVFCFNSAACMYDCISHRLWQVRHRTILCGVFTVNYESMLVVIILCA